MFQKKSCAGFFSLLNQQKWSPTHLFLKSNWFFDFYCFLISNKSVFSSCCSDRKTLIQFSASSDLGKPHMDLTWKAAQSCRGLSKDPGVWVSTVNRHSLPNRQWRNEHFNYSRCFANNFWTGVELESICWRSGRSEKISWVFCNERVLAGNKEQLWRSWLILGLTTWLLFPFWAACGHSVVTLSFTGLMCDVCPPGLKVMTDSNQLNIHLWTDGG